MQQLPEGYFFTVKRDTFFTEYPRVTLRKRHKRWPFSAKVDSRTQLPSDRETFNMKHVPIEELVRRAKTRMTFDLIERLKLEQEWEELNG